MKPSHHAESTQSAPTHYAPSVPMSVYRELAAELRANKAVIDSLNSRNQQLMQQNQRLKQEIHNVVQATLNLGQFAGVARQAAQANVSGDASQTFPSAIAPDTLAKLVRAQGEARKVIPSEPLPAQAYTQQTATDGQTTAQAAPHHSPVAPQPGSQPAATYPTAHQQPHQQPRQQPRSVPASNPAAQPRRVPRPIQQSAAQAKSPDRAPAARKPAAKSSARATARQQTPARKPSQRADIAPAPGALPPKALPKLFTEQAGEHRTTALSSDEEKEIGGIWLALSIILIIVTAFGAGFLIMKPLLNDR